MNYPIEAKEDQPPFYRRPVLVFSIEARPEHENFTEELFVDHRCPNNSPFVLDCEDDFHPDAQYGHLSHWLGLALLDGGKESPQKRLDLFRGPCSAPPVLPSQPSQDLFLTDMVSDSDFLILEDIPPLPVMLDATMDDVPLLSSSELMMLELDGAFEGDSDFPFSGLTEFYKNLSRLAQEFLMASGLDMPFEELLAEAAANQARAAEGSSKLRWKKATKKKRRRVRLRRTMSAPPEQPLPRKEEVQKLPQVVQLPISNSPSRKTEVALEQKAKVGREQMVSPAPHTQLAQGQPEQPQPAFYGTVPKQERMVSAQNGLVRGAHFEKVQLRESQQTSHFPSQESQFEDVTSGQVQAAQVQKPSSQGYSSRPSRPQGSQLEPHHRPQPQSSRKKEPVRPKSAPQHSHQGRSSLTRQLQASETAPGVEVKSLFGTPDWLTTKASRPQSLALRMRSGSSATAPNQKRSNVREAPKVRDMDLDIMERSELEFSRALQVSRKRKAAPVEITQPVPTMEVARQGFSNSVSGNFSSHSQPSSRSYPPRQEYLGSVNGNSSSRQAYSKPGYHLGHHSYMPKAKRRKSDQSVASPQGNPGSRKRPNSSAVHSSNGAAHSLGIRRSVLRESSHLVLPRTASQFTRQAPQSVARVGGYTRNPVDPYYSSRDSYAEQAYFHGRNGSYGPQSFQGPQSIQNSYRPHSFLSTQSYQGTHNGQDSGWDKAISRSFQEASLLQPSQEPYPESPSNYTAAFNYSHQVTQPTNSYAPDEYDIAIQELVATFGEPDSNMDVCNEPLGNDLYTLSGQNFHYLAPQHVQRERNNGEFGHLEYKQNYSYQVPRTFSYNYGRDYRGQGYMGDAYQSASRQRR